MYTENHIKCIQKKKYLILKYTLIILFIKFYFMQMFRKYCEKPREYCSASHLTNTIEYLGGSCATLTNCLKK